MFRCFFLSGLTFSRGKSFRDFLSKKIKTLIIPYYIYSLISIGVFAILAKYIATEEAGESILMQIGIMLYGNSRPDIMKWNTPLWFLPCLFGVMLIIYTIETFRIKWGGERNLG